MSIEKWFKYKSLISISLIFVCFTTSAARNKEKELPLRVNGQQKFGVTVKNADPPIIPTSICKKKAHKFRIEIEKKSKKWIAFMRKIKRIKKDKEKKTKKEEKWITIKSNIITVARGESIVALFNANGEKMKEGINIGRIEFKCKDCTGPHKLPETVKVIGSLEEIQARKNWSALLLKRLTGKRQKFYVNPNENEVVIVKGDLPGRHAGGGLFLPGRPKGATWDFITPLLKAYRKHIADWNKEHPDKPKRIDETFVKKLEEINKKYSGRNVIIVCTDAAAYNLKSPLNLDDEERAFILLAALHELKHFKHRGKGYSDPRDEMEVVYWQLFSREVKKFFKTYIYIRRRLPQVYIPRNAQRMLVEYYVHNWKLAKEKGLKTDLKKVAKYNKKIIKMVMKYNKSIKKGEKKIELPQNFF